MIKTSKIEIYITEDKIEHRTLREARFHALKNYLISRIGDYDIDAEEHSISHILSEILTDPDTFVEDVNQVIRDDRHVEAKAETSIKDVQTWVIEKLEEFKNANCTYEYNNGFMDALSCVNTHLDEV